MQCIKSVQYTTIIILSLLSISSLSYAGVAEFSDKKTTCFIFNNNKLINKSSCSFDGVDGGAMTYIIYQRQFTVKKNKSYNVVDSAFFDGFDKNGKAINAKYTTRLNGVKAKSYYRDKATLKKLSETMAHKYIANMSSKNKKVRKAAKNSLLTCFKAKKSADELCYPYGK